MLAGHFLKRLNPNGSTSTPLREDVVAELVRRPWPGNVRELRNAIERAAIVARGQAIRPEHLPPPSILPDAGPGSLGDELPDAIGQRIGQWTDRAIEQGDGPLYDRLLDLVEPPFLAAVLARLRGHRAQAADRMGIHRSTLRQKLRKYGLE